eukprot:TRINITY_DN5650_c0_g2_i10.p1 TRINITY_DN5650_c0_g2~~TRINITY_DN5650_c0_g2_i10.p1  ORF type:complete len:221 (+),score=55.11 TRINITY_DN5650_c0_g2_i10:676-1338(+)
MAFGYGEVAFATSCLLLGLLCAINREGSNFRLSTFLPCKIKLSAKDECWVYPEHKQVLMEMSKLSGIQCLLGECEKILIIFLNKLTVEERSEYSFVVNLASLVLRVLYFPMEDSAYAYFAKLEVSKAKTKKLEIAGDIRMMCNVVSLLSSVALLLITYSYNFSYALLKTFFSSSWANEVLFFLIYRPPLIFSIDTLTVCSPLPLMECQRGLCEEGQAARD